MTEVLYAVPLGEVGDANKDGTRDATGDEFVELVNPHDKPINLRGYRLVDKSLGKGSALSFTFPDVTLKPGEVAVVFNGYKATIPQPVGDATKAAEPNTKFGGARVFSMQVQSSRLSFSNSADAVVLLAPTTDAVQIVKWGKPEKLPTAGLIEEAPVTSKGSVQRNGLRGELAAHATEGGVSFSPGRFGVPLAKTAEPTATTPEATKPPAEQAEKPKTDKPKSEKPKKQDKPK